MKKNKINIVWLTKLGSQTKFEKEYIVNRVFGAFDVAQHQHTENLIHNNAVLVFSCNTQTPSDEYWKVIEWYKSSNTPYFLYHLSDERCVFEPKYYEGAKHVWRNYGASRYSALSNVTIIPLGFQSGYMNTNTDNQNKSRHLKISFAGSLKNDRQQMVNIMNGIKDTYVHTTTHFNDPNGLSIDEMIEVYKTTLLAPCPMGWYHQDSFRIMEALEWGAIPVVRMHNEEYFAKTFPFNPFLVVRDWDELERNAIELYANKETCLKNVWNWYSWFIKNLKAKIKNTYESLL